MRVCNCALPAMHGGSTKCCEGCPNNFDDSPKVQLYYFNDDMTPILPVRKKKTTITEYDENGKIKKIIETEE